MKVSVIIATYNGRHKLPALIDSLENQSVKEFECIVVIDGSEDDSEAWLKMQSQRFHSLEIFSQQNKGRSGARNAGARLATGDLLVFYDDDMQPAPDSIERHVKIHLENKSDVLVSGNQVEYHSGDKTDIQNYKAWLVDRWILKYRTPLTKLDFSNLFFTAANCSFRKSTWIALKGFDQTLTDAEDFDLAWRALETGIGVWFDKQNIAIHNDPITCVSYIHRLRQYNQANKLLAERYTHPSKNTLREKSFLKQIVYRGLAMRSLPKLIDSGKIFRILPRSLRYKIYTLIIHSLAVEYSEISLGKN